MCLQRCQLTSATCLQSQRGYDLRHLRLHPTSALSQALVQFLARPVNPADKFSALGVYPAFNQVT